MRTNHLRASTIALLVSLNACALSDETAEQASQTRDQASAEFENSLPADGCTWVVHLGDSAYAPDDASVAKIKKFTNDAYGSTPATIAYKLTGRMNEVQCGWNTVQALPEISVTSIAQPQ